MEYTYVELSILLILLIITDSMEAFFPDQALLQHNQYSFKAFIALNDMSEMLVFGNPSSMAVHLFHSMTMDSFVFILHEHSSSSWPTFE